MSIISKKNEEFGITDLSIYSLTSFYTCKISSWKLVNVVLARFYWNHSSEIFFRYYRINLKTILFIYLLSHYFVLKSYLDLSRSVRKFTVGKLGGKSELIHSFILYSWLHWRHGPVVGCRTLEPKVAGLKQRFKISRSVLQIPPRCSNNGKEPTKKSSNVTNRSLVSQSMLNFVLNLNNGRFADMYGNFANQQQSPKFHLS